MILASTFLVLRTATTTSCERFPTSRTGDVESERPCTVLLHFLKLFGDLVASVRARLAARAGSWVLSLSFAGGTVVSISAISATLRGARGVGVRAVVVSSAAGVAACDGDMRNDVVRAPFS